MKKPVLVAFALTSALITVVFVARWVGIPKTDEPPSGLKVVIVQQPINAGMAITALHVKAIDWPDAIVPQGAFARATDAVGRVARVAMIPGEPVLPDKLAPVNATGGLSSIIPEGKRAITVKVNEVIAVAGFALPGSFVDVLVSGKDADGHPFSRTVLSRVKILAIAQETTSEKEKPKVVNAVTLELTPSEAEKLDLARSIGELSLDLRNEFDTAEVNSPGARLSDIVAPQSATASSAAQPVTAIRKQPVSSRHESGLDEIRGINRNPFSSQ